MLTHPDIYIMSRDEWLEVNRVLAGCALAMRLPDSRGERAKCRKRLQNVVYAQSIMSEIYERAAKKVSK